MGLIFGRNGRLATALRKDVAFASDIFLGRDEIPVDDGQKVWAVIDKYRPDVLINCVAASDVDPIEKNSKSAEVLNARLPRFIGEACGQRGIRVIHFSTDYIYSGVGDQPHTEEDIPYPINEYGQSKLTGVNLLLNSHPGALIFNLASLDSADHDCFPLRVRAKLLSKETVLAPTDQICHPSRTEDVARVIALVREVWRGQKGLYNLASPQAMSRYEWACLIRDGLVSRGLDVGRVEPTTLAEMKLPAERPKNGRLSMAKLDLDFSVQVPAYEIRN